MPLKLEKKAKLKVVTTAVKKDTVVVLKHKGLLTGYESIVDQLSSLESIITPEVVSALKRQKRLQDELRTVADNETPADVKAVVAGTTHNFVVSERGEQRTVVVSEARKQLGEKLFSELARILLGDVDKYLTPSQQIACVNVSRTGPRKGQLVAK